MVKWILIILFSHGIVSTVTAQEEDDKVYFTSQINIGFIHLGSYSKERPIIYLNQDAHYQFSQKVSAGIGLGLDLYPAAFALPLSFSAHFRNYATAATLIFSHAYSRNLKVSPLFFSGNRYTGSMDLVLRSEKKLKMLPSIGYSFIWDRYGGKSLSFLAGIKFRY